MESRNGHLDKWSLRKDISLCQRLFECGCLASGKPNANQDAFAYSANEFHAPFHSLQSRHGRKSIKIVDEFGAMFLMGPSLLWTTANVLVGFWGLLSGDLTAMTLAKFANTIIEWTIVLGAWLMWYTMCYWCPIAHWFWKLKIWPLPSLMPGGFMPRLAAFSLGILMFVTSTLVSEGRVKGSDLQDKFHTDKWEYCRATDLEADDVTGMWFSRFLRRPPAVSEGYRCFGAEFFHFHGYNTGVISVHQFNSTDFLNGTTPYPNATIPYFGGTPMTHSAAFPMDKLASWGLVSQRNLPQYSFHCMYQCVKWKTVGLMSLIKNVGSIVAGSAVVVKTSDTISKSFGGRCLGSCYLGLPLITQDTSAEVMEKVMSTALHLPGKGRSKLSAAFVCILAMSPLRFASKLDVDGYYTVDYYVTAVFLSSLVVALVVRQWNPYKVSRIAYTDKMWSNGEDQFIDFKKHTLRTIDLYEWIHLTQESRADHLLGYARIVSVKAVNKELQTQKNINDLTKLISQTEKDPQQADVFHKAQEDLKKSKKKLLAEQTKAADKDNDNVMSEEYHNKNATLMMKTIKAMAVLTTSPPVTGDDTGEFKMADDSDCPRGSILYKNVVIREGAIGTLVDVMQDGHIKVRFPKTRPKNAPLMAEREDKPQYDMEIQPKMQSGHETKVSHWMRQVEKSLKQRLKKPDGDGDEDAETGESHSVEELDMFEDVVVPLEHVIECSQEWLEVLKFKYYWSEWVKEKQDELDEEASKLGAGAA